MKMLRSSTKEVCGDIQKLGTISNVSPTVYIRDRTNWLAKLFGMAIHMTKIARTTMMV